MLRKANRRIAVVAAAVVVVASFGVLVPSAFAATVTQIAPFSNSVTSAGSASFTDQLLTSGVAPVTFLKTGGSASILVVARRCDLNDRHIGGGYLLDKRYRCRCIAWHRNFHLCPHRHY